MRRHLLEYPDLVHRHADFPEISYFRSPALLAFIAENPVRHGVLPSNVAEVARVILEAGAKNDRAATNEALGLVCSGRVVRECGAQIPLIDLLGDYGAEPGHALAPALAHGEFDAVEALLRRGAPMELPVAAALGRINEAIQLLAAATATDRHRALTLASQFGHTGVVRLLLEAGEDPNRLNPPGFNGHSTPLHQAALAGHMETVRLLVQHGASLEARDTIWNGTPAGWANHSGQTAIEEYLLSKRQDLG